MFRTTWLERKLGTENGANTSNAQEQSAVFQQDRFEDRLGPARDECESTSAIINEQISEGARSSPAPIRNVGEWLSLVEHLVRDQGVGGSNPLSPTIYFNPVIELANFHFPKVLQLGSIWVV